MGYLCWSLSSSLGWWSMLEPGGMVVVIATRPTACCVWKVLLHPWTNRRQVMLVQLQFVDRLAWRGYCVALTLSGGVRSISACWQSSVTVAWLDIRCCPCGWCCFSQPMDCRLFFAVSLVDLEIFAGHRFICHLIRSVATYFLWRFHCCGVIPFFDLQH
jgi:hypothetical protein